MLCKEDQSRSDVRSGFPSATSLPMYLFQESVLSIPSLVQEGVTTAVV
jgi:hypothetical protein